MIAPRGIIQRIAREPVIHLEWIETDDGELPTWTTERKLALIFPLYHDADTRAKQLGGRPIFAMTVPAEASSDIDEPRPMPRKLHKPRHRFARSYANAQP